eukprot:5017062-Pyramimonas_sp.AAC.1
MQLAAKEMKLVEDLDPSQAPTSTDDAAVIIQGAQKFKQLGVDGMRKLMASLFEGSSISANN